MVKIQKQYSLYVYMMAGLLILPVLFLVLTSCSANPLIDSVEAPALYRISGRATAGPLKIQRIELSFANGFGSTTVSQNDVVTAQAQIRFSGNGVFKAQWLVDGRIIENVYLLLSSGSLLSLPMADSSRLPTFEPGLHEVKLLILQPQTSLKMPIIKYFVKLG